VSSCLNDSVTIFHSPRLRRVNNRKRTRIVCIASFVILVSVAVLGALVSPLAAASDLSIAREAPSLLHPFGTDNLGRDMLLRTLAGLSTSIGIGLLAALVSSFIALVLGTLAALGGKKIDS
jgi:peptide/nickel transport system permease protein